MLYFLDLRRYKISTSVCACSIASRCYMNPAYSLPMILLTFAQVYKRFVNVNMKIFGMVFIKVIVR